MSLLCAVMKRVEGLLNNSSSKYWCSREVKDYNGIGNGIGTGG